MEKKLARMGRLIEAKLGGLDDESSFIARGAFGVPMRALISPRTGTRPEMDRKFDGVERDIASLKVVRRDFEGSDLSHPELESIWDIDADLLSDSNETVNVYSDKAWVSPNYELYLNLESKSRTGKVMVYSIHHGSQV